MIFFISLTNNTDRSTSICKGVVDVFDIDFESQTSRTCKCADLNSVFQYLAIDKLDANLATEFGLNMTTYAEADCKIYQICSLYLNSTRVTENY